MKICLALPSAQVGGSFVFLRTFRDYLSRQGLAWTHDLSEDYDFLLFNSWTLPYRTLLQHKRRLPHLRLIHRIDGAAQDYGRLDGADWLQRDTNRLADLTLFQSQYSYQATHERFRLIRQKGPIIHNPVDTEKFNPQGESFTWPEHPQRVISVGWSPNPMKGTWRIPILARQNPDVEFVVVGRGEESLRDLPNLRFIPFLEHDKLPQALRSANVYLSLIQNDACPNVILEALASGLPVLYVASGGVPELVRDAGLPLADDAHFGAQLAILLANRDDYATRARQIALDYHQPEKVFAAYLDEMEKSERQALPGLFYHWQAYLDYQLFIAREQPRKWQRILSGQQSWRKSK